MVPETVDQEMGREGDSNQACCCRGWWKGLRLVQHRDWRAAFMGFLRQMQPLRPVLDKPSPLSMKTDKWKLIMKTTENCPPHLPHLMLPEFYWGMNSLLSTYTAPLVISAPRGLQYRYWYKGNKNCMDRNGCFDDDDDDDAGIEMVQWKKAGSCYVVLVWSAPDAPKAMKHHTSISPVTNEVLCSVLYLQLKIHSQRPIIGHQGLFHSQFHQETLQAMDMGKRRSQDQALPKVCHAKHFDAFAMNISQAYRYRYLSYMDIWRYKFCIWFLFIKDLWTLS